MSLAVYRLPDVKGCVRLSKSQIYALIAKGEFPPPFKLSARASGWDAREVENWIADRIAQGKAA